MRERGSATSPLTRCWVVLLLLAGVALTACNAGERVSVPHVRQSLASTPAPPGTTGAAASPTSVLPTDLCGVARAPAQAPADQEAPADAGPVPTWDQASRTALLRAAGTAMAAFARPDLDHDAWWAGLEPLLTPESAPDLIRTDPGNIPASRVSGTPRITDAASAAAASVSVPTDSGDWTLVLVRADANAPWLTSRITPPPGQH